jgi:hypothetical protein
LSAVALGVAFFASGAQAAPKVDPQLKSKLLTAKPTDLFGVILTFKGERVTEAQVSQVLGLGVSGGYRMNRLPVVAVNATAAQVRRWRLGTTCAPSTSTRPCSSTTTRATRSSAR